MTTCLPALTVFFGSFLLFGIQPMLGRTLLPPFGGTAAVWTVCLAAYQLLLLVGYSYAHAVARRGARSQRRLHLALLAAAVLWSFGFAALRLALRDRLGDFQVPSLEVLFCVLVFVGLPYVLLSANSTLIQAWLVQGEVSGSGFKGSTVEGSTVEGSAQPASADSPQPAPADAHQGRGVYRLYAVSNFGSLLGLLVYPFALEPFVSLNVQWYGFAVCLLLYTLLLAAVARRTVAGAELQVEEVHGSTVHGSRLTLDDSPSPVPRPPSPVPRPPSPDLPPPLTRPWLWFALPALSTFLLNAVTAHLSTDVTPVPMMWALLLTAFLLSYIIGFSAAGERGLFLWAALATLALLSTGYVGGLEVKGWRAFLPNLGAGAGTVLVCCTFLHSWLYRIRPDASQLTRFYLGIAAGGAAGGACASLLAPALFNRIVEYPLALLVCAAACAWLICAWNDKAVKSLYATLLLLLAVASCLIFRTAQRFGSDALCRTRSFYGCLRVTRSAVTTEAGQTIPVMKMHHGCTLHGTQSLEAGTRQSPTTYYGPKGGGLAVCAHPKRARGEPMRVGLVGLGAGTLACYGRPRDLYRFYEVNPQVAELASATNLFSFLSGSPAKVEVVLGDARKRLEAERAAGEPAFDVLVVDAYSGDSVPLHLATREAFQLYVDRLSPDGILALHISNWHIDLFPLCKAAAAEFGLGVTGVVSASDGLLRAAYWVFLSRPPVTCPEEGTREIDWALTRDCALPTDERGSLLSLLRFGFKPALLPDT